MRGETRLTYNGVTLYNVLTRRFQQEAVYDQSGTDLLYYRFTVVVTGYVSDHYASVGVHYPEQPTILTDAATQHQALRGRLLEPRGAFLMVTGLGAENGNGTVLLKAQPNPTNRPSAGLGPGAAQFDVTNGPKPKRCDITRVVGSSVFQVEFEIEICKLECDQYGNAPNNTQGVLSHRWSCADAIDDDFYTTRTFSGRLVTVGGTINPHELRHWVVPRLTIGFRRKSMTFRVTEDGLTLEYQIVDREIAFSAPRPATSWHYSYSERSGDGKMLLGSISVYLAGPRNVVKAKLVEIALAIFRARLLVDEQKNAVFVQDIEVTDTYSENENAITFTATVMRTPNNARETFGAVVENIGQPITKEDLQGVVDDYDFNLSRGGYNDDPIFVSGPIPIVGAFKAYLQSPCNDQHRTFEAVPIDGETEDEDAGPSPELDAKVVKKLEDEQPDGLSEEHRDDPYTVWSIDSKYLTDQHRAALPIAGQTNESSTAATKTTAVVALASPTSRRIIRIQGQRVGKQPQLPEPKRSYKFLEGSAELLRFAITPEDPRHTPDNKHVHTVTAEIEYAVTVVPDLKKPIPIGYTPWEDPAFADRKAEKLIGTQNP